MEQLYPSEIARLVLGYLKEVGCLKSWKTFLQESTDLHEYCRLYNEGKRNYPIKVYGKTLLDILEEYCILQNTRDCSNGNISQDSNISKVCAVCNSSKNPSVPQGLPLTDNETKKDGLFDKSSNDAAAKSMFDEHNTADVTDFNQHTGDICISEAFSTQVDLNSNGMNPIHMESNYNCKISNMQETTTCKNNQSARKTTGKYTISASDNKDCNGSISSFVPQENVNPSEYNSNAVIDSAVFVNYINSDVGNVDVASEVIAGKNDHDIDNAETVTVNKHSSDIALTNFRSIIPNLVSTVIGGNNIQTSSNQSKHMLSATQLAIQPAPVFNMPFSTVPTLLMPHYIQDSYPAQNVQYRITLNPTVYCYGDSNSKIYGPTIPTVANVIINPTVLTPPKAVVMPNVENFNTDVHALPENVENFQPVPITRKGEIKIENINEDSYKRGKNKDEKSSKASTVPKKKCQSKRKQRQPSKATRSIISDKKLDKIPVISVPQPSPSNSDQQSVFFSKEVYVSDESDTMLVGNANRETICNKKLVVLVTPLEKKILEHYKIFSETGVKTTDMLNCQNDAENISEHQSSQNSIATHLKSESSPKMDLKQRKTTKKTLKNVSVNMQDLKLSENKIFANDHEFSQKDVAIVIEKSYSLQKNYQEYFPITNTESCSHNIKSIHRTPRNSSVTNDGSEQLTLTGDRIKEISKLFSTDTSSTLVDCSDLKIMTPEKKDGFFNNDIFNINSSIVKGKRKNSKLCSSPKQIPEKVRKLGTSPEKVKHDDPMKQLPNPSNLTFHSITANKSFLKNSSVIKIEKNAAASISIQPLNVSSSTSKAAFYYL